MNVTLKSFCEDVPLADPKNSRSFLVFEKDGEEFRIPVGRDAIQALAKHIYKASAPEPDVEPEMEAPTDEPEEETQATVFGGDDEGEPEDEELPPDDDDDPVGALELKRITAPAPYKMSHTGPNADEDGVPSL